MEEALHPACTGAERVAAPCESVSVSTSARLHFGFLDPSGRSPRPFGSFGLAIDRPKTRLALRRGGNFRITGADCARAESYLRAIVTSYGLASSYRLHLDEVIPAHAGLGSGTQLALAIGTAVATLEGLPVDLNDIAERLDRGKRSGIGIATFGQGGAVLDGGPGPGTLPLLLARVPFPSAWRVLLIFDPAKTGVHGGDEAAAFAALPDFPEAESAELGRRVLGGALPALAAKDFRTFCDEVGCLQKKMGAYFAPMQGGPFVSAGVAIVLNALAANGVTGLGQSSWGPTGFAFAKSEAEGEALLAAARASAGGAKLRFEVARGRNESAIIEAR